MKNPNRITYRVFGRRALFTTPESKLGGEKLSYQIPTYQALVGITESIYWKPTIKWIIEKVRIINPISMESVGVKTLKKNYGRDLSFYTYLKDVEYEVQARFVWNEEKEDLAQDRNENKHYFMAKRALKRGGRRDIFLGTRECQAYVEPVEFGEKPGAYDDVENISFDFTFLSFSYPDENSDGNLVAAFWYPVMKNGIIEFINPKDAPVKRIIREDGKKEFKLKENIKPVEEEVEESELSN